MATTWPKAFFSVRVAPTERLLRLRMPRRAARYAALVQHANEAAGGDLLRLSMKSAIYVGVLTTEEFETASTYLRNLQNEEKAGKAI